MEAQPDFKELLELLNAHGVEYVIVGGYAVAFHGAPRYTRDLDLYVRPTPQNAERVLVALRKFGFGDLDLTLSDFVAPDRVVQLGVPPVRVDFVTSIDGVSWERVWENHAAGSYADVPVKFIGRQELIANKRASRRTIDLADTEALGEG